MHNLFITFITFLYMFRATLCSSSGGFTVYIQHLVLCMSLFLGDRSVHRQLEEGVPYVKLYRKTPKYLYPKLNGYGDIGQRKLWTSLVSAYCTLSVTSYSAYLRDGARLLQLHSYVIARYSWATLAVSAVYSSWKSVEKYDTCASVFVVLFNGFMSLTSYFDEKYRY